METLKITVNNKEQAALLTTLMKELNFVTAVESIVSETSSEFLRGSFSSEQDFLSMFGLWKGRDISVEKIRSKAWREVNR